MPGSVGLTFGSPPQAAALERVWWSQPVRASSGTVAGRMATIVSQSCRKREFMFHLPAQRAQALALWVIAERLEHDEEPAALLTIAFAAAAP